MKNNKHSDKALWRKLITVIILKLIIIMAIWAIFMKDNRITVDEKTAEQHILAK